MTTTVHKNLTGADLHEPKGADTALSGQIYVSDGAGSGSWIAASSVVTSSAWDTGDVKPTLRASANTGWILWNAGSIGDGSSSASLRANADCADLFTLIYNNYDNALCPVSGGRGASAAADFAVHKSIALPAGPGRALGISGSGSGLTSRGFGVAVGSETYTILTANLPAYTPSGTITVGTITSTNGNNRFVSTTGTFSSASAAGGAEGVFSDINSLSVGAVVSSGTATFTGSAQGGSATAFSLFQPTIFQNFVIKL